MSLISFHKFLITTAIVFCLVFALRQFSEFRATRDGWTLLTAIAFGIAVVGLAFYLKHLRQFLKIPTARAGLGSALRSDPKGFVETYLRPAEPPTERMAVGSDDRQNKLIGWIASLIKPQVPPWKKNGHNGHEPE